MSSLLKRTVVVAMCTGAFVGTGVGSVYAGEITGIGLSLKVEGTDHLHANSECAFSGLNDEYWAPEPNDTSFPRVQTPKGAGHFVSIACRGGGPRR